MGNDLRTAVNLVGMFFLSKLQKLLRLRFKVTSDMQSYGITLHPRPVSDPERFSDLFNDAFILYQSQSELFLLLFVFPN